MSESMEFDVACVGGGFGGLTAALTAVELGLRPVVLEKTTNLGGVTALSAGHIWVPGNRLAAAAGVHDSWEKGASYLEQIGAGTTNVERAKHLLRNAPEAMAFLETKAALTWSLISCADYYAGTADDGLAFGRYLEPIPVSAAHLGVWRARTRMGTMFPARTTFEEMLALRREGMDLTAAEHARREADDIRCGGAAIAVRLLIALDAAGVPIHTNVDVRELRQDHASRAITGLQAVIDGRETEISVTRGVLLATGGYDRNRALMALKDHLDLYGSAALAGITGDSLTLAGMCGAQTAFNTKPFMLGFHQAGEVDDEGAATWRVVSPQAHSILVNREARRFVDEMHYPAVSHAMQHVDGRIQERRNLPAFIIGDRRYLERFGFGGLSAMQLPQQVVQADDLGELAAALRLEPDSLRATVDRYNAAAAAGTDTDFHRGETPFEFRFMPSGSETRDTLGEINSPPYFGARLEPVGMGFANCGLVGDPDARVLDWRGDPIGGLYATGNSLAMIEIGSGYQSGFANTRGMTYGYLAAKHMAGQTLNAPR